MGRECEISKRSNVHFHTRACEVTAELCGFTAPERGVSANPLELVCEGLVSQRGAKIGRGEKSGGKRRERKTALTGF